MGKIGTLVLELTEKANDLGYESIEEACNDGYYINWDGKEPTFRKENK